MRVAGNSACTRARTRSSTSWMPSGSTRGVRCGVSIRSISACRRSASLMITCVYSALLQAPGVAVQLALEQLRRAAQAAERVLDLVREVADQLAARLLLGGEALLARLAQLLLDRAQLGEQRQAERVDARHGARQRHLGTPAAAGVGDVLRRVVPVRDARLFERALQLARARRRRRGTGWPIRLFAPVVSRFSAAGLA